MAREVFISHSAQDKNVSEAICAALEQDGIQCWVAPRDVRPGKSFPGEITRAIQQTKVMLLLFSRHSNSSEQVLREVQLAVDCRVPIVRLRLEDIPLSDDLRYYLSTPHWLDALTHPLSKHIPPLVQAIKELLEQSPEPAPASASPAPVEVTMNQRVTAGGEKGATKWKPFVIGAVVLVAAALLALWAFRPEKKPDIVVPSRRRSRSNQCSLLQRLRSLPLRRPPLHLNRRRVRPRNRNPRRARLNQRRRPPGATGEHGSRGSTSSSTISSPATRRTTSTSPCRSTDRPWIFSMKAVSQLTRSGRTLNRITRAGLRAAPPFAATCG
jgi:hypothetical protein